jgi:hypothetical protein
MPTPDHVILHELIPDAEVVRRRLAAVLVGADLPRSQFRISERPSQQRERLHRQRHEEVRDVG